MANLGKFCQVTITEVKVGMAKPGDLHRSVLGDVSKKCLQAQCCSNIQLVYDSHYKAINPSGSCSGVVCSYHAVDLRMCAYMFALMHVE